MTLAFKEVHEDMEAIAASSYDDEELMTTPAVLVAEHQRMCDDDADSSAGRAALQELVDFVPPFDPAVLNGMGMEGRHNINYGLAAAVAAEAIGAYVDLFTAPASLARIKLKPEAHEEESTRRRWGAIMASKWTEMIRNWDAGFPRVMSLANTYVVLGVAIPYFDDKSTIDFNIGSLEDCHFPSDSEAIPSKIPLMTTERKLTLTELYRKIEKAPEGAKEFNGWNVQAVRNLIENACRSGDSDEGWNYEKIARRAKANRMNVDSDVPDQTLVWGLVRELDGKYSIYATPKTKGAENKDNGDEAEVETKDGDGEWLYRRHKLFDSATQAFQIFAFGVGNKNLIYTIRSLVYAIYESAQADNVLRCKLNDAAAHRAGEIYQPDSSVESVEDLQFIDMGFGVVAPRGLKGMPQNNQMRLDESIIPAIQSNREMVNLHSMGVSQNSIVQNPTARRNEKQVEAEISATNRMAEFAMVLFQNPWNQFIRELLRRSFEETQSDPSLALMVEEMLQDCEDAGVPRTAFEQIDFRGTHATRLAGAGSKANRLMQYERMAVLYPNMDAIGQERFDFDWATEIQDAEKAEYYFGLPGERRAHDDVAHARAENRDLLEGVYIDPIDGENKMVHLEEHILELTADIDQVAQGEIDMAEWTMRMLPLYDHTVKTLTQTTVIESIEPRLNQYRQAIQQVGEQIENGLRHINKNRQMAAEAGGGDPAASGAPGAEGQGLSPAQQDVEMQRAMKFAESQAKIQEFVAMSETKRAEKVKDSILNRQLKDAETAAKIRREGAETALVRSD